MGSSSGPGLHNGFLHGKLCSRKLIQPLIVFHNAVNNNKVLIVQWCMKLFRPGKFSPGSIEPKRIKYANQVNGKAFYDFRYEVNKFII